MDDEKEHILKSEDWYDYMAKVHDGDRRFFGTAWWDGQIVAIGGWFETSPGVAEGLFIPDARMLREHPFVFARTFKRWISYIECLDWPIRIQTHSIPRDKINRLMETLGFTYERQYVRAGNTYNLWGREKINGTWGRRQR